MKSICTLFVSGILLWGCESGPCGEHVGDAVVRSQADLDKYSCHTSVTVDFQVNVNTGLRDFEMPYLRSIGGSLLIVYSHDLEGFQLPELEYVEGDVRIQGNSVLPDLDGLGSLSFIGGSLKIIGWEGENDALNYELSDIEGLFQLESVAGDVEIYNNPKLPTCAAEALVERLVYFPGIATIRDNDDSAICDSSLMERS